MFKSRTRPVSTNITNGHLKMYSYPPPSYPPPAHLSLICSSRMAREIVT